MCDISNIELNDDLVIIIYDGLLVQCGNPTPTHSR
jgi:hypothetical protein